MAGVLEAPRAAKKPYTVTAPHGKEREDLYYWLRDDSRKDQEMMDYLQVPFTSCWPKGSWILTTHMSNSLGSQWANSTRPAQARHILHVQKWYSLLQSILHQAINFLPLKGKVWTGAGTTAFLWAFHKAGSCRGWLFVYELWTHIDRYMITQSLETFWELFAESQYPPGGHDSIFCVQAERDYTEAAMADTVGLQAMLFKELKGRIKEADESVPIRCDSTCLSRNYACLHNGNQHDVRVF